MGQDEDLDYPSLDPAEIERLITDSLAEADRLVETALAPASDDPTLLLDRLDDIARIVAAARGRATFARFVDPHAERRRAAEHAFTRLELWRQALVRRDDLAAAIARADVARDGLDPEQRAVITLWQVDLREAGAGLPPEAREEVASLRQRLLELSTAFVATLGEPPTIELTKSELTGLPVHLLAGFASGSEPGTYRVPMTDPACIGILENVPDRAVRERIDRGAMNRGGDANRQALAEAARIRRTLAALLGYASWADLRTAPLIAGDASAVGRFLVDLSAHLEGQVRDEREAMRQVLAKESGVTPQEIEVEDWDQRYVDHLQRAAVGVDADAVRDYLGFEDVLAGMVTVMDETFGVRLEARPARIGWHPDVRGFDLIDSASGAVLAAILLDPYQRDGKTVGAWMDVLDPGSSVSQPKRPPVLVLCTNATAPAAGGVLLTLEETSILFHEFGHIVHYALALDASRYWAAGDAWVRMDWIESPSMFLGSWGTKQAVLARFARHVRTGAPIPPELLGALGRATPLNLATRALRQVYIATFDQAIHGPMEVDIDEANMAAWAVRLIPFPAGTRFYGSSAHLMDGYDATYYGYLWAEVLSDDLMAPFREAGYVSTDVGGRFRSEVLQRPLLVDPIDGVGRFLGRLPSREAYFERIAGSFGDDP